MGVWNIHGPVLLHMHFPTMQSTQRIHSYPQEAWIYGTLHYGKTDRSVAGLFSHNVRMFCLRPPPFPVALHLWQNVRTLIPFESPVKEWFAFVLFIRRFMAPDPGHVGDHPARSEYP